MAKYRAHILFLALMTAYFITRYVRSQFDDLPHFIQYYFTDLLFVPAMCLFALIVLRFLRREPTLTIHWLAVLAQVGIVSIYFEWYLPTYPPEGHIHVADFIDCLMYLLGGIAFILIQPFLTKKNGTRRADSEM
ncbi:MAG: hypothetical protein HWE22_12550 [Flavobacteriales bacterium]|nr:hypothetical protein [Flavobacteriales bacterium]